MDLLINLYSLEFFFSSRRRHTRWNCDWSSDVCSSDLFVSGATGSGLKKRIEEIMRAKVFERLNAAGKAALASVSIEIGRASCRERVEISEGAVSLKKKDEDNDGCKSRSTDEETLHPGD